MKILNLMLASLLVFAFGCATVQQGKMIDPAKLKQLEPGKTKTLQVEQLLGKPDNVEPVGPGEAKYTYDYSRTEPELFATNLAEAQKLEIWIKGGIVQTYKLTYEEKEPFFK
jgi:outer membrane protein assembly factor BamE (lipoprotein component of BamABCDE complex)